jgi:hypothetical protein
MFTVVALLILDFAIYAFDHKTDVRSVGTLFFLPDFSQIDNAPWPR